MMLGLGSDTYGPRLPCCADAAAAAASTLAGGSGPACDPNCIESPGAVQQTAIERMQAALDSLLHGTTQQATDTATAAAPGTPWYVWALGGIAAVLIIRSASR